MSIVEAIKKELGEVIIKRHEYSNELKRYEKNLEDIIGKYEDAGYDRRDAVGIAREGFENK